MSVTPSEDDGPVRIIVIPQDIDQPIQLREIEPVLDAMKEIVGGWLEVVPCAELGDMWVNEEGKLQGLRRNLFATHLAHECFAIMPGDFIVGDVFLAGHNDKGDTVDVPDLTIEVMDRVYGITINSGEEKDK
jgi:hypothetical protein